jgi:autotransporter-associated beta strand protein
VQINDAGGVPTATLSMTGAGPLTLYAPAYTTVADTSLVTTISGSSTINVNQAGSNGFATYNLGALNIGSSTLTMTLTTPGNYYYGGLAALNFGATTLTGSPTFVVNGSTFNPKIGPISGSGYGITKSGTANLTLIGSSTYSGATVITAGTLFAGATNALSPSSAFNVSGGTLDTSAYADKIASLTVSSSGTLNLGLGNLLTTTGADSLAGTLNLSGTIGTLPETLITYASETGTFSSVTGTTIPATDKLTYTSTALEIVAVATGPANLTWNNTGAASPTNGTTWDTTNNNWNNGSAATTFSNTSNTSNGDNVTFNDANNVHYAVTISTAVTPNTIAISTASPNAYTFTGTGSIGGGGGLTDSGSGTVTISDTGPNAWGSTTVTAGTLKLGGSGALPVNQPLNISSGATVQSIAHNGSSSNVVVLQVSTLSNSGTLDLTNNSLAISSGSTVASITTQVKAAYNNGLWNGTSSTGGVITSSTAASNTTYLTALGVATGLTSFDGVTVPSTDILVKYTYYGDTNLDGAVDGSDYTNIDNGFHNHLTGWQNGDFNYDGVVDGSDYTLIDNAYNMQGATLGTNPAALIAAAATQIAGGAAVPEPTSLGLLSIGAIGLLGRRQRRRI